jgi:hypothetical protein
MHQVTTRRNPPDSDNFSEGVWPYKMVTVVKKNVIASSDRSPYWKLYENGDGQPELFVFRKFR